MGRNVSFDGRGVWVKDGVSTIIGALFLQRCLLGGKLPFHMGAVCSTEKHCFRGETQFLERSLRLQRQECFFVRNDVFASNIAFCLQDYLLKANYVAEWDGVLGRRTVFPSGNVVFCGKSVPLHGEQSLQQAN